MSKVLKRTFRYTFCSIFLDFVCWLIRTPFDVRIFGAKDEMIKKIMSLSTEKCVTLLWSENVPTQGYKEHFLPSKTCSILCQQMSQLLCSDFSNHLAPIMEVTFVIHSYHMYLHYYTLKAQISSGRTKQKKSFCKWQCPQLITLNGQSRHNQTLITIFIAY